MKQLNACSRRIKIKTIISISVFCVIFPSTIITGQQRSNYDLAAWLIAAVHDNDTTAANWALDQGLQIDFKRSGSNALHNAIYKRNVEMVKFLLRKGASLDSLNAEGQNALQYAEKAGHPVIIQLLKNRSGITDQPKAQPYKMDTARKRDMPLVNKPPATAVNKNPAFKAGDVVLHSRDKGKTWEEGTFIKISTDPEFISQNLPLHLVENKTKTDQRYLDINFITTLNRQPSWTNFFVGDWDLYLSIASTERVVNRDVYQIISGGDRLPPLRIHTNRTYTWIVDNKKVIKGNWKPNDNAPGIILLNGDKKLNWLMYNTSDAQSRKIYKSDYIMLVSDSHHPAKNGFRINP